MIWLFLLTVLCYEGFLTFLYLEDKLEKFSIKNKGDFLSAIILGFLPLFNILLILIMFKDNNKYILNWLREPV